MSEVKIGAIDGDKLAAYLKTSVDLSKQWSSESDYKRGLKDERLRILDRILEHILTGTFALTAPPRDFTPEMQTALATMIVFIAKHGLLEKWKDECAKADEAQKESKG